MDHPAGIDWTTSSYSMRNPIRNCVRVGTSGGSGERYLGDSQNPGHGALTFSVGELNALLHTA